MESSIFCEFVVRKMEMYSRNSHIFDWAVQNKHKGALLLDLFFFYLFFLIIFLVLCKWLRSCEPSESLYGND